MPGVYGARLGAVSTGTVLDVMVQDGYPQRVAILDRVQVEIAMFSRDLWAQRGLKPPEPGSRQNDLLSPEDVDKLARVRGIYRDHFADAVVRSTNYERQRLALLAVYRQLNDEGLAKLLLHPDSLGVGL
ncbi:MAG: hypothetical protein JWN15_255 [Firmicutes bacterium]|nr:hypothetical protein [Bacillota bacterium]